LYPGKTMIMHSSDNSRIPNIQHYVDYIVAVSLHINLLSKDFN